MTTNSPSRRSVGALHLYLNRMRAHPAFKQMKEQIARVMKRLPAGETWLELGQRFKDGVKEVMLAPMIWEELGFSYIGPVDGHDTELMIDTFRVAKTMPTPGLRPCPDDEGQGDPIGGGGPDRDLSGGRRRNRRARHPRRRRTASSSSRR